MRARALVFSLLAVVCATALWAGSDRRASFPHELHARLFPVCTGCHAGAADGQEASLYPSPEACTSCHDGQTRDKVAWTGPRSRAGNLRFSHATHTAGLAVAGQSADCSRCHAPEGTTTARAAMRGLTGPRPEYCLGCHAHQAPTHLAADARCTTCHVPLAAADRLDSARIAGLPRPPGHEAPDFASSHGVDAGVAQGRCAICHARESCERCHANGASVPAIAALASDPRVAALAAGRPARYPTPASHASGWEVRHATAARSEARSCANCHAQPDCRTCHIGEGAQQQIASLPVPRPGGPQGALAGSSDRPTVRTKAAPGTPAQALVFSAPRIRPHPPGFAEAHGAAAASASTGCTSCHARAYCASCHAGSSRPVFHPVNFLMRHGADAYGGAKNCSSCHNTETFCKSCHQGAGLSSGGRIDVAFHTGQPMWLLQHGEAARKGLEGCVSCHKQQDCARCHSATGGWGVNPHGPGFDPQRMADRNQLVCARCHVSTPGIISH